MDAAAATIAVIADTHFPRRGPSLPEAVVERLRAADLIVHAGDWSDMRTVRMVRGIGPPLVTVQGNVEEPAVRQALPRTAEAEIAGLRIGVVHDGGQAAGRIGRLRRRFPAVDLVIFGHSHIPLYDVADDGFMILNPGSPTERRRAPRHTMAEITVSPGGPPQVTFHAVDDPVGPLPADLVG
jgi:putative phosphoesterase